MKEFQVKDFDMSAKRPSLNSVIAQRKRLAQQQAEQDALLQEDNYTETEAKLMEEASSMSVVDHLSELRMRLVVAIVAIVIGTLGAYYYVEDILQILVAPAGKLYYTKPTEAFFTYMKILKQDYFILKMSSYLNFYLILMLTGGISYISSVVLFFFFF